jgi:anthranilate synthase component 1
LIPVYKEISADLKTPVSAYLQLAKGAKYSFLLESVEGEEKIARFSFAARNPQIILQTKGRSAKITRIDQGRSRTKTHGFHKSPLELIREILKEYQFVNVPGLPRFCGGLVGYVSYDTARFFERLPDKTKDDLKLPDILMVLAKDLVIFDHRSQRIKVISCA